MIKLFGLIELLSKYSTYVERFMNWLEKRDIEKAKFYFDQAMKDKESEVYKQIIKLSQDLAQAMTMRWLDTERIRHCLFCVTRAPLQVREVNGVKTYLCDTHTREFDTRKALETKSNAQG